MKTVQDIGLRDELRGVTSTGEDVAERRRAEQALRESEARFRQLAENIDEVFWITDPARKRVLYVSPAYETIWGRSCASLYQSPDAWMEAIHPDDHGRVMQAVTAHLTDGNYDEEYRIIRAQGDVRWIRDRAFPVRSWEGEIERIVGVARDITARKLAEESRAMLVRRNESLVRALGEVVYDHDVISDRIEWAGNTLDCVGWSVAELGTSLREWAERIHPDDRPRVLAQLNMPGTGLLLELEYRFRHWAGHDVWIHDRGVVQRDDAGRVTRVTGIMQDISGRKRAEDELRAVNERYVRQETALIALTRSAALQAGQISSALQEIAEVTARTLKVGRVSIWRHDRGRNEITCIELFERGESRHSAGTILKAADYPAYFRALATADVIAAQDAHRDPRTADFSQSYLTPLGIGAMLDAPVHFQGAMIGVLCCEHLGGERQWPPDEQTFAVAVANLVSLLLAQAERRRLEGQLRQAQKMEAIGQLAGGIAHDFNNILGAISGNAELAMMLPAGSPQWVECQEAVLSASRRAGDLVKQILAFSRRQEQQRKPMQLHLVVREALKLLRSTVPASVEFETNVVVTPTVLADPTQIHQVTMNLCTNAWHAMKDHPGVLKVELTDLDVDEDFARLHPELRPGRYVRLMVADNGCGMDASTLERIFEPFFTTKPQGEGTGLGLSVVHGIMKSHDGGIVVQSKLGEGTIFHLYFPVFEAEVQSQADEVALLPRGRGQHILFVDDEAPLTKLAKSILEPCGYQVTTQTSPAEALALFEAQPERFDLVITDFNMPGMDGTTLGRSLLKIRPGLPMILSTGYSGVLTPESVRQQGFCELLPKPCTIRTLSEAVHRVFSASTPANGVR